MGFKSEIDHTIKYTGKADSMQFVRSLLYRQFGCQFIPRLFLFFTSK